MQYLKDYLQITEIALHLDNDAAERLAAETIQGPPFLHLRHFRRAATARKGL